MSKWRLVGSVGREGASVEGGGVGIGEGKRGRGKEVRLGKNSGLVG